MYVIVYRSKPRQPWIFITYYSGTRAAAEQSARWTEEQERKVFKRTKTIVKALNIEQWNRMQSNPSFKHMDELREMTRVQAFISV